MKSYLKSTFTLRLLLPLVAALICVSCNIDDTYDLSNMDDSGLGIGTDDTSFDLPLVSIKINTEEELSATVVSVLTKSDEAESYITTEEGEEEEEEEDLFSALDTINALLPESREEGIDLSQIEDDEYTTELVEDLIGELQNDSDKCEIFFNEVATNEDYSALHDQIEEDFGIDFENDSAEDLQAALNDPDNAEAVDALKVTITERLQESVAEHTRRTIVAGYIDIGEDILDLLNKNIDGDKNTLRILVIYESDLTYEDGTKIDLKFASSLVYSGDNIVVPEFDEFSENEESKYTLPDGVVASADIFEQLLSNLSIEFDYSITNYDPTKKIDTIGKSIKITLIAHKTGSLIF